MVRRCSVPGCRSGLSGKKNKNDKVSVFLVPKDENKRMKWAEILSCSLNIKSGVCELHFKPINIISEKIVNHDEALLYKHIYKRKRLQAGALPIANNDENNDKPPVKQLKFNSASIDQHPQTSQITLISVLKNTTSNINANFTQNKAISFKTENTLVEFYDITASEQDKNDAEKREQMEPHYSTSLYKETMRSYQDNLNEFLDSLFEKIFNEEVSVILPNKKWGVHIIEKPSEIIFCELVSIPTTHDEKMTHILRKKVVLNKDGLKLYICQQHLELEIIQTPTTKEELEHLLINIDNLCVCEGGPKTALYKNIHFQRAYKDENNKWRHVSCPIVINHGRICRFCSTLDKTIAPYIIVSVNRKTSV